MRALLCRHSGPVSGQEAVFRLVTLKQDHMFVTRLVLALQAKRHRRAIGTDKAKSHRDGPGRGVPAAVCGIS